METRTIIRTIKKVMPAVISIAITKSLETLEKEIPADLAPLLPFKNGHLEVPGDMMESGDMVKIGGGSGFFVHENGTIITNKHVVADKDAEYTVLLGNGEKLRATVLARDPIDDVAILNVNHPDKRFPIIPLGSSSHLELGEPVLAIGNALGLFKNTVSKGIISGLSRSIRAASENTQGPPVQELRGLIQTDAAINPGNSGGPLVNLKGHVIGINAAIVFAAQSLGFAIPINAVKRDLEDLEKYGRIRRPLLGLRYIMIDENLKEKMHLPVAEGALIIGQSPHADAIAPESPADKAGLKQRDIITHCNGEKLTNEKTIQDFLEDREVGDALDVKVLREHKEFDSKIILEERL